MNKFIDTLFITTIIFLIGANIFLFNYKEYMMINEEIKIAIFAVVIIILLIYVGLVFILTFLFLINSLNERKLYRAIKFGLLNNQISNVKDIEHIIDDYKHLKNSQIKRTIYKLLANIITGKEHNLQNKVDIVKDVANQYKEEDPFINMPETMRFVLKDIKAKMPNDSNSEYLIRQLQDIFNSEQTKIKKQYTISFIGIIVSLFSLFIAIYSLF